MREDQRYVVRGNMAGAQYVSITLESGTQEGGFSQGTVGVLNDTMFDVAADGSFEIFLGGEERPRNWLALPENTSRVTTRHYIEAERCAASDPDVVVPMSIECLDSPEPSPRMDDAGVAAAIRRVINFARSRTLLMPRGMKVPFVSEVPNEFVAPVKPGAFAFAAFDAAYTQTSWLLEEDEALVIRGRWPECRTGTVCLWTPHLQTLDYANRQVSLNRAQTELEDDGSWKMIVAHRDPGHPNWLDTEGRREGAIFVRFMLPEGEMETPQGEVVRLDALAAG